jgi:hypothetical protein
MSRTHIFMEAPSYVTGGPERSAISQLFIEVCPDGFVTRELGFDSSGELIHRAPTVSTPYCLCGSRPVDFDMVDDPAVRQVFRRFWIEDGIEG